MQAIGEYFGLKLRRAHYPMHGKVSELSYDASHPLFSNITTPLNVCRYHSLILEKNNKSQLTIVATSNTGEPMAVAHKTLPIWAVQFHPEAILTPQGLTLINNWLTCYSLVDTKLV